MKMDSVFAFAALLAAAITAEAADPLASWNDGPAKKSILDFVARVTKEGSPDFVPPAERIATFATDGTLWVEQPAPVQACFALARVKALAGQHPEWKERQPFKGILEGDMKALAASGEKGVMQLLMATHAGTTTDEFQNVVSEWIAAARHPRFRRPFTELVYQPMLELLAYLRANGVKTFIVSGGGVDFMRPWTERVYGIPPEQVIGSTIAMRFELRNAAPLLVRLPAIDFVDDKEGKPIAIWRFIGRRPIAAFGNTDGDLAMLQWTAAGPGARLCLLVRHTDPEREYAYERESPLSCLDKALDEAKAKGWTVADMKRDWKRVFAFEKP